ncbi:hypothetical protein C8R45DRAFT_929381 [Mycena sanguinolenta]|nr:hypothetical protein C8R45DRAFT_929381 [Mycena sanguinolenta]
MAKAEYCWYHRSGWATTSLPARTGHVAIDAGLPTLASQCNMPIFAPCSFCCDATGAIAWLGIAALLQRKAGWRGRGHRRHRRHWPRLRLGIHAASRLQPQVHGRSDAQSKYLGCAPRKMLAYCKCPRRELSDVKTQKVSGHTVVHRKDNVLVSSGLNLVDYDDHAENAYNSTSATRDSSKGS